MGLTVEVITFHCIGDTPTRIHLRNSCFVLYLILLINISFHSVEAGICWSAPNRNGRCFDLLRKDVTQEECCSGSLNTNTGITSTAYSEDLTDGQLFYHRALRGGVPCATCKATCEGVQCGPGKKCVLKNELQPACICAPKCSRRKRRLGPVCGSDGRTYRHVCRLLKRKCRKDSALTVEYYGSCEDSCHSVRCADSKTCILDHNLKPHCVRCKNHCPPVSANSRPVCGVNNVTYSSYCHLQRAACLSATAIQVAYRGHCKRNANCQSIRCGRNRKCLRDVHNNDVGRCVTCPMPCPPHLSVSDNSTSSKELCASDGNTYANWCSMMNESCRSGVYLRAMSAGPCPTNDGLAATNVIDRNPNALMSNTIFKVNPNDKIAVNR